MKVLGRRLVPMLTEPVSVGSLTLPPPALTALAAVGGILLVVVLVYRWAVPSDELAYWLAGKRLLAGEPLYDPGAVPGTPYAYWYPPPLAQVLAPFTALVPDAVFVGAWSALLLVCLWFLGGQQPLAALALVAIPFVAVELWYRNVHLVLAVLAVLALRRSPFFWIAAAAIKVTPVLGLVYLAARGEWRKAALVGLAGSAVLAVSVLVSPAGWAQFVDVALYQAETSGASLVPIAFPVRFAAAVLLVVVGGRIGGFRGEALLIAALVVGNPTLWATALSLLVALAPLWRGRAVDSRAQHG